ncbi:hypothetical protein EDD99_5051 [Streptomyces sp. 846.5]|nr:hypothetical protein [Streptomyces sp. 846.5]TDU06492.1 hypothetical protein EDD99_5051 [Streptomyces sp. 846.5]
MRDWRGLRTMMHELGWLADELHEGPDLPVMKQLYDNIVNGAVEVASLADDLSVEVANAIAEGLAAPWTLPGGEAR